ncbi:hypothetical protein JXM67_12725 [candidate division WOR-3 bacterium]|nr:hypothetical protein [candidate division WOR-3 bacterium]
MAKVRIANWLGRIGSRLFRFLSRWEDKGVLPRLSCWLRLSIIGVIVVFISGYGKKIEKASIDPMCYMAVPLEEISISDVRVEYLHSRKEGTIQVRAKAEIKDSSSAHGKAAESAYLTLNGLTVQMKAVDGSFDEAVELIKGNLSLNDAGLGSKELRVYARTDQDGWGTVMQEIHIII